MAMVSLASFRVHPLRSSQAQQPVWIKQVFCSRIAFVASAKRSSSLSKTSSRSKAFSKPRKQREIFDEDEDDDDDLDDEAALEALFSQLEKDLEDERAGKKVDVEVPTEEQLAALEQELMSKGSKPKKKNQQKNKNKDVVINRDEDAADNTENADEKQGIEDAADKTENAIENQDDDNDEDTRNGLAKFIEEAERLESERVVKRIVKLERWQLRKLKAALDLDKKNLKVKALAGETGLDRRDVLTFLREPPPQLIELIDSISDEEEEEEVDEQSAEAKVAEAEEEKKETFGVPADVQGDGPKAWYGRKRIRKEYLETFEKVYRRTKRPTGALIQNIVELTHVPRKRILDWFENRRREDAVRREERRNLQRK